MPRAADEPLTEAEEAVVGWEAAPVELVEFEVALPVAMVGMEDVPLDGALDEAAAELVVFPTAAAEVEAGAEAEAEAGALEEGAPEVPVPEGAAKAVPVTFLEGEATQMVLPSSRLSQLASRPTLMERS